MVTTFNETIPSGTDSVTITDVPVGTYDVVIDADGYVQHTESITVTEGATTTVTVTLNESTGTVIVSVGPDTVDRTVTLTKKA